MRNERHGTGLVLVPAAATLLGVSVAWAGTHDPLAQEPASAPVAPVPVAAPAPVVQDPKVAALAAQIDAAGVRVAELQATLAARAAATAQAETQAASAAAAAPAARESRPAPAPQPAPPVDTTTGASG